MQKPASAKDLAVDIVERSICNVKVGAAIEDNTGILAWGWNSEGFDGYGLCAERHAIQRANKRRLRGATIYIAGRWSKTGKFVPAFPCNKCMKVIEKWGLRIVWRNNNGKWEK